MAEAVEAYILEQDEAIQPLLRQVQSLLAEILPNATQKMSYGLPTFWQGRNLIHFGAAKSHLGIYPGPEAVETFKEQWQELGYPYTKATLKLPYGEPLPVQLLIELCRFVQQSYAK